MEIKSLIDNCISNDPRAQKKLFEMLAPKMMGVCLRYASDRDQASDMLQDGMIKVFNKLSDYKFEGNFEGWVRRIIVNSCLDLIRKESKFVNDVSVDDYSSKISFEEHAFKSMEYEELLKLIHSMPHGYRTIFNMFAIEGYSHKEIADALQITESTSKSQYLRARTYLQTKLEEVNGK